MKTGRRLGLERTKYYDEGKLGCRSSIISSDVKEQLDRPEPKTGAILTVPAPGRRLELVEPDPGAAPASD